MSIEQAAQSLARARSALFITGAGIYRLICTRCDHDERVSDYAALADVPRCPRCGALIRPDVVLFGEMLPPAKVETLTRELERGFDVVLSIGTSSLFPYIAHPVFLASARGAVTIEINPEETPVSDAVQIKLWIPAVEALTAIVSQLEGRVSSGGLSR